MADVNLFTPGRIDGFDTKNRFVMAPMTRCRSDYQGVPTDIVATYYAQRASAGLIITEGIAPSAVGLGYVRTPSIESAAQIAAWKKITDAVHAKGGRIFAQFMHVAETGRPMWAEVTYVGADPFVQRVRHCLMPLSRDGETVDMIFVVTDIDRIASAVA